MVATSAVGNYDDEYNAPRARGGCGGVKSRREGGPSMGRPTRQPLPAAAGAQHKPGCMNNGSIEFGWWPDDTAWLDSAAATPPLASLPGRTCAGDGTAANETGWWPHGTPGERRTIMSAGKRWEKSK